MNELHGRSRLALAIWMLLIVATGIYLFAQVVRVIVWIFKVIMWT